MTVGFTASAFDLLHAGHIQMLREAKEQCDYLLVGLQMDPSVDREEKNAPVQNIVERYTQPVSYTHLRAHETKANIVCRLLLEKKNNKKKKQYTRYILYFLL